jgi:hypothetical protein
MRLRPSQLAALVDEHGSWSNLYVIPRVDGALIALARCEPASLPRCISRQHVEPLRSLPSFRRPEPRHRVLAHSCPRTCATTLLRPARQPAPPGRLASRRAGRRGRQIKGRRRRRRRKILPRLRRRRPGFLRRASPGRRAGARTSRECPRLETTSAHCQARRD